VSSFDAAGLSGVLERDVVFFENCESTQIEARRLADSGAPAGTLVVANSQSGGKGRLGRTWQAASGKNLLFSLVMRPPIPPEQAPLLCLATAVALADVLDCRIKWPNDLLDDQGRKHCGILAEMDADAGYLRHAVLGVGINVNQVEFPPELPNPGSMALVRGPQNRAVVLRDAVFQIERWCAELSGGSEAVLKAWRARAAHLGQRIRVGAVEGVARDLRGDGALLIETSTGIVPVLAGDVELMG
jgi:BirA family transcriptional regulator, biotin operon repressor / biotin---[acetyl-CoA-carboxylase] ligase